MRTLRAMLSGTVLILGCASLGCNQPPEERLQKLALELTMERDAGKMRSLRDDIHEIAVGGHGTEVTLKAWHDVLGHDLHHGSRDAFDASLKEARSTADALLASAPDDQFICGFAALVEMRAVESATMHIDRAAMETSIRRLESGVFLQPAIPATIIATNGRIKSGTVSSQATPEELDAFCLLAVEDLLKLKWAQPSPDTFHAAWQFCRELKGDEACREILEWRDDAMASAGNADWKRECILQHYENFDFQQTAAQTWSSDFESYRDAEMTAMFGDEWKPVIESINRDHTASADHQMGDDDLSDLFDGTALPQTHEEQTSQ